MYRPMYTACWMGCWDENGMDDGRTLGGFELSLRRIRGGTRDRGCHGITGGCAAHPWRTVLISEGKIVAVGADVVVPDGAEVVDASGGYLMPGIIDVHSHMGVYPWPSARAHGDGNEAIDPVTARVRAEDSVHVSDPAFSRARAGGVTTVQILPGSANLVGGESSVLKLRPSRTLDGMRFASAPRGIKMACGENPKRVYGDDIHGPSTRMGSLASMRAAFQAAKDYRKARETHRDPPAQDANLDTLLDVLDGKIRLHVHCYRHDDIEGIYRVMDEFGVQVASIQHALEAYKVRDIIIAHGTGIATWADWWGFKMEAYDGIPHNAALFKNDGGVVAIHSGLSNQVQRLNIQAAKTLRYGMSEAAALETITLDPAKMLYRGPRGTIAVGKDADLALFSAHPLDMYSLNTHLDRRSVGLRSFEGGYTRCTSLTCGPVAPSCRPRWLLLSPHRSVGRAESRHSRMRRSSCRMVRRSREESGGRMDGSRLLGPRFRAEQTSADNGLSLALPMRGVVSG